MPYSDEQRCLLWLSAAEITADRVQKLLAEYGCAEGIWDAFGTNCEPKFRDTPRQKLEALHSRQAMDAYCARLEKANVHLLFQQEKEYPELLSHIDDPPYVLYYAGDLAALKRPMIAVIGSRDPSGYGREMARGIARGLAEVGVCIVSGMARGIDSCAHEGALKAGGITVAVLGSGLNVPYPPENVSILRRIASGGGMVISEYPLDAGPVTYHFPHRNRVISGLSHALVFVEGKIKSGGMLTVTSALQQGREVFAVPGQVGLSGAEGPNAIIREGARMVTSAGDILADLNLDLECFRQEQEETLVRSGSALGQKVLEALSLEPLTLDTLCQRLGRQADEMMTELSMMEIMGQIRKEPGNIFSIAARNMAH